MISLLEQVERGKDLPAPGVSETLREVVTALRLGRVMGSICNLPAVNSELNLGRLM